MMQTVEFLFHKGLYYIIEFPAYEHWFFICMLVGVYAHRQWTHVLHISGVFAAGYTIALLATSLDIIRISSELSAIMVAISLLVLALFNLKNSNTIIRQAKRKKVEKSSHALFNKYSLFALLGLVHGFDFYQGVGKILPQMGMSHFYTNLSALSTGLFVGQMAITAMALFLSWLFFGKGSMAHRDYILFLSAAAIGISFTAIMSAIMTTTYIQP